MSDQDPVFCDQPELHLPEMHINEAQSYRKAYQSNESVNSNTEDAKPSQTLQSLIAMAILNAPDSELTSTQIFEWISNRFPYYDISQYEWRESVVSIVNQDESFVTLERTDAEGCYYHTLRPGVQIETEKKTNQANLTSIGMAKLGNGRGRARLVRI